MNAAFVISILLHLSSVKTIYPLDSARAFRTDILNVQKKKIGYEWDEKWYDDMDVDHFSFTDNRTFSLRYLINTQNFKLNGPIFFYTGNEGSIEVFAENTGFMWELAPKFGAALVFAEHRFYGKTMPFGNASYSSVEYLGYHSSEQALADFVQLIVHLKKIGIPEAKNSAVIAFGGSYGGMLAAWIRIKYPHIVDGAIAASAPVFWFVDKDIPDNIYDRIVTRSFTLFGCNASEIYLGWKALDKLAQTDYGRDFINTLFKIEEKSIIKTSKDIKFLKQFIRDTFEAMAMVNYPYPTNFLSSLPAWPVKVACGFFSGKKLKTDKDHANAMYSLLNLYHNYTGEKNSFCVNPTVCTDSAYGSLDGSSGWFWQACTEMIMPMCAGGPPNDFFEKDCPYTLERDYKNCINNFGTIGYSGPFFRPHWAILNYGDEYPTASNIVFSNGFLDPWSGGGWSMKTITNGSLVSVIIKDGAHHYDLRAEHPHDTKSVKEARRIEITNIMKWLNEAKRRKSKLLI